MSAEVGSLQGPPPVPASANCRRARQAPCEIPATWVHHAYRDPAAGFLCPGNIYLAGVGTLEAVLRLAQDPDAAGRDPEAVLRELAALELAYLFPVAGKFRSGGYDGQIQYRLNGWGRALAVRLTTGRAGADWARALQLKIGQHLASESQRYTSFLSELDVARQNYGGNLLDIALALPIPVLV